MGPARTVIPAPCPPATMASPGTAFKASGEYVREWEGSHGATEDKYTPSANSSSTAKLIDGLVEWCFGRRGRRKEVELHSLLMLLQL